ADLTNADLSKANLNDADLRWVNFTDANLAGAKLNRANLNDADLNRTNLDKTDVTDSKMYNVKNIEKAKNLNTCIGFKDLAVIETMRAAMHADADREADVSEVPAAFKKIKDVKVWGVKIEGYGLVRESFEGASDLTKAYEGLSEVEANLLKYRMLADGKKGIPGKSGTTMGVLFSVNFIPGNVELPVEIKWISPDRKIVRSEMESIQYEKRRMAICQFPEQTQSTLGNWTVEFFYQDELIGEHKIMVMAPERYEAMMRLEKKTIL
ncbi:MAG: pentapeptide repeat-containing protein, partial [Desulfobulbaceae bacterium]|nr:pentapeptide repeat-containing protein [Desulfobulbaceae bacterium]